MLAATSPPEFPNYDIQDRKPNKDVRPTIEGYSALSLDEKKKFEADLEASYQQNGKELLQINRSLLQIRLKLIKDYIKKGKVSEAVKLKNSTLEDTKSAVVFAEEFKLTRYQRDINFKLSEILSQFPEDNEIGLQTAEKAYRISFDIVFDQLKRQIVNKEDDRKMKEILVHLVKNLKRLIKEKENAGLTSVPLKTKLGVYEEIQRKNEARK